MRRYFVGFLVCVFSPLVMLAQQGGIPHQGTQCVSIQDNSGLVLAQRWVKGIPRTLTLEDQVRWVRGQLTQMGIEAHRQDWIEGARDLTYAGKRFKAWGAVEGKGFDCYLGTPYQGPTLTPQPSLGCGPGGVGGCNICSAVRAIADSLAPMDGPVPPPDVRKKN